MSSEFKIKIGYPFAPNIICPFASDVEYLIKLCNNQWQDCKHCNKPNSHRLEFLSHVLHHLWNNSFPYSPYILELFFTVWVTKSITFIFVGFLSWIVTFKISIDLIHFTQSHHVQGILSAGVGGVTNIGNRDMQNFPIVSIWHSCPSNPLLPYIKKVFEESTAKMLDIIQSQFSGKVVESLKLFVFLCILE